MTIKELPEILERFFRLRYFREIGISVCLGVLFAGLILIWIKPSELELPNEQFVNIDALHIKKNTKYFHQFLKQVKNNDGVLVMGTSETGTLGGNNYWQMFNGDSLVRRKFSVLGGAGRCRDVYLPLMMASPEVWKGIDILLFVNPTYWRYGLNEPQNVYQTRYLDKGFLYSQSNSLTSINAWKGVYDDNFSNEIIGAASAGGYYLDKVRSVFYNDYRIIKGNKEMPFEAGLNKSYDFTKLQELKNQIDTTLNVSYHYYEHASQPFYPRYDTVSTYRSKILSKFIQQCENLEINLTVIIGPYNAYYAKAIGQEDKLLPYEEWHQEIQDTLNNHNLKSIDLWDMSYMNNSFKDYQHHSEYGAYLIYQRLKAYYNEKH